MTVFQSWLHARHAERGWSQRDAAKAYDVTESNVSNWLNSEWKPSARNLIRISLGLGIPIASVMRAAGYDVKVADAAVETQTAERAAVLASLPQFAEILDLIARQPVEQQAVYVALIRDQLTRLIPHQGTSQAANGG